MSSLETTISLLLLILLGYLFRGKFKIREQREGLRTIILSLALPATILIALLKINFSIELIIIPILAMAFNLIMYFLVSKLPVRSFFHIPENQFRTLVLLIPSLAPGLSCFPFILEFSGESGVAMAALADIGNKIFVLIIAYVIAMKWYYDSHREITGDKKVNVKDVFISLINEPVNLVIVTAVVMLSLGLSYDSFPGFIKQSIDKISLLMTPMILLFIGISIRLTWHQVRTIFSFLFFRSSIAFLISAILLAVLPVSDLSTILLIVVFPQSACSFWPYSHMAAVNALEDKVNMQNKPRVFDLDFAMNVLACSMPFSVVIILIVFNTGQFFSGIFNVLIASGVCLAVAVVAVLISSLRVQRYANANDVNQSS
jgi:malate permease and related proteins